ncbi:MAG: hypothetical protein KA763_14625 [Xanthomonadales bacterium]|nr:hypothetical protein [Xanthomonadales bacterium]
MSTLRQYDADVRNALISAFIAAIGPAPTLKIRTGSMPAGTSAARTGTILVSMTLPSTWQAAPSNGVSNLSGTWSGTASAAGDAGHFEFYSAGSPTEVKYQGLVTKAFPLTTTASAAINSNVLTFASALAASVGDSVSGAGIPAGTTVREKSATTVTLSNVLSSAIASSTDVFFGDAASGALWLTNVAITVSATVTVTRHRITAPGA